ncbi:uncharacterized protein LOC102707679 [Oryza brachyantha]|uniref:uncharacterized protein LOC102707679 n=1 Tax=Oryza brachyantha TaxID=4533 RepID=UPI001ADC15CD|nr:uncharacterized protein LOC102707679 [Oryza brachyantha]
MDLFFFQMRSCKLLVDSFPGSCTKKTYMSKTSNSILSQRLHNQWDTLMMIFPWLLWRMWKTRRLYGSNHAGDESYESFYGRERWDPLITGSTCKVCPTCCKNGQL